MKWIFENTSKLIALLSLSLVVLTTAHDWGYFIVIGSKFRSVQTTYDYITNAIEWMPSLALAFVFSLISSFPVRDLFSGQASRREGFRDHEFLFQSRIRLKAAIMVTFISLFLFGYSWFQTYPSYLTFYVGGGSGLVIAAFMFAFSVRQLEQTIAANLAILLISIVIVSGAFVLGVNEANSAIRSSENVYKIELKVGVPKSAVLLRAFEKGVLIWNADTKTAELIRWEQIDGLSHVVAFDNVKLICRKLSWFCPPLVDP
jgi:hypothetical protein